jgi:excisionase family DNA binding protein
MFDNSASSFTLTEKQLAKFLGISVDLVRQLRRQGRLPFVKINSRVLYLRTDAVAFLEHHRQQVAEVAA